jgi:CRP-like cAMP-binding protein
MLAQTVQTARVGQRAPQPETAFGPGLDIPAIAAPYARNEEIYAEEDETKYVYKVLSGAVRVTRFLSDGRRHLSGFYFPGEVFGFEPGRQHKFSAEAVVDSRIAMIRRSTLEEAAARNVEVSRGMWDLAEQNLERLHEHTLLLGRMSAAQRLAAFLLEISARLSSQGVIDLPMSRSDIADYLGLTIETVSRTFTQLERDRTIEIPSARQIVLRNRARLAQFDA